MYQWIGLGEIYRKTPYLIVKNMVSCKFSLKLIHWMYQLIMSQKYQQNICRRQPSPRLVAWDHWRWSSSIRPFQSCPSLDDTLAEKGFFLRLEKDRKLCFWKSIEKWNPVENSCHFCFFIFYESYCNLLQLGTRRLCFCS